MIAAAALAQGETIARVMDAAASPYPPSFDNNPVVFGWALFSRLLIFMMSAATIVRLHGRNKRERLQANHPVYYHRMVSISFLWAALLGSGSDVLTYLFWGEVSNETTTVVMLLSRLLDAVSMIPFLMALSVPLWLGWLRAIGVLQTAPSIILNGVIHDLRVTWTDVIIPIRMIAYSGAAAAGVTVFKYTLWIEHGRP